MKTFEKEKKYLTFLGIATTLALALNIFIIVNACLNGEQSTGAANPIVEASKAVVNTFSPNAVNETNINDFTILIRKLFGHFGLFAVDALLTGWALFMWIKPLSWYKSYRFLYISLSYGAFLAALTEIIQVFIPGRSGQFTDSLIDFGGYIIGLLILNIILFFIFKKQNKDKNNSGTQPQ